MTRFALRVDLLAGRYAAADPTDLTRPEWPPHPARFVSALVAGYHSAPEGRSPAAHDAIRWLAGLPAPMIVTDESRMLARATKVHYVPINDGPEVNASVATQRTAWGKNRTVTAKPSKKAPPARWVTNRTGARFPTMATTDGEPVSFWFVWDLPGPVDPSMLEGLTEVLGSVTRLGHASTLVRVTIDPDPDRLTPTYVPDPDVSGDAKRVARWVYPDQVDRLEAAFNERARNAGVDPGVFSDYSAAPRPTPAVWVSYRDMTVPTAPAPVAAGDGEWVKYQFDRPVPARLYTMVAKAVRNALLAHAANPRCPFLSGHQPDGAPADSPHLTVVPFLATKGADTRRGVRHVITGVGLWLPATSQPDGAMAVYQAIRNWEQATGNRVTFPGGEVAPVTASRVTNPADLPHPSLGTAWHQGTSTVWTTLTPVAFTVYGPLLDESHPKHAKTLSKVARQVAYQCQAQGLPEPVSVSFSPYSRVEAGLPVHVHGPYLRSSGQRLPVAHMTVEFTEPVTGPVFFGAGRYYGTGVLVPLTNPSNL